MRRSAATICAVVAFTFSFRESARADIYSYTAEDGTVLSVELWESWFTFYLGEAIERADVNVFPIEPKEE